MEELEFIINYCKMIEKEGRKHFKPDDLYYRGMKMATKHIINYCKFLSTTMALLLKADMKGDANAEYNAIDRFDLA